MRSAVFGCLVSLLLPGCAPEPKAGLGERIVTLPNGRKIVAEVMLRPEDQARGMMFRDSLPPGRGMLFIHETPAPRAYWMHNVRIPLDIIWMDAQRRVVEIAANTPGCLDRPENCPSYGGAVPSLYVLELAGGQAAQLGITEGVTLDF
jgi:uncharacterized membrane protein (UPF0127 family)